MGLQILKAKCIASWATTRIAARVLLLLGALGATAFGCAWVGTSHSVRFNDYQTEREMGRLSPLPTLSNGTNDLRAFWDNEYGGDTPEDDYSVAERQREEVDKLWESAEVAEKNGNFTLDRELLRQYIERTYIGRHVWFEPSNRQHRRNSAMDRLDVLRASDRGTKAAKIEVYLNARRVYDSDDPVAEEIQRNLNLIRTDSNLKDNAAYLKAALLYRKKEYKEAAQAFTSIARKYSNSEKREASLFMAALANMKASSTYSPTSGDESHLHEDETAKHPVIAVDEAWRNALAGFRSLMAEYPRGKYFNDAKGWVAYLLLRSNDRAGALVEYYRLLANQADENVRIEAAFSLTLVRHHASDEEMSRVENALENQPDAALAYAYHNIYNYAIDPGSSYSPYEEIKDANGNYDYDASRIRNQQQEKDWERNRAATSRKELIRVIEFTRRLMSSHPKLPVGGAFALRAAQASLELGNDEAAVHFARRAVASGIKDDERAQALWTIGVGEHRLHHFEDARKSFQTLLSDNPKSHLTEGARRTVAMIAEDEGDLDGALEQYIALDYKIDVGYFIDVLMTTEQLAAFIARHPDSPKRDELTYALGVRHLRANRWSDAREVFSRVRPTGVPEYSIYAGNIDCMTSNRTANCDIKAGEYNSKDEPIITSRLIMRDIQTANSLEALARAANTAEGDEAKAEALYQFASYQFDGSSLLFYNPVAWTASRYWNLSQLAGEGRYRATNESQVLFTYMQEHDTLARALKSYLEVVRKFPQTRAGRDALYTAAVCHERLSNYNPYWRGIYGTGLHAGERMVTYADVKAAYPRYQLPRGTYTWKPSTRTVNGAPGWAPPPKPLPRLTRTARVKLLLNQLATRLTIFWNETGRRWLAALSILIAVWFTSRRTTRDRKLLRLRIGRLRLAQARQIVSYPWTAIFWIDPVEADRRERVKQFLEGRRQKFRDLARDDKSRPILVRNIVSHSLLTGLLLTLYWTLHVG